MDDRYIVVSSIVFILILLVVAKNIILVRQKKEKEFQQASQTNNQPIGITGQVEDKQKRVRIFIFSLAVLVLMAVVFYKLFFTEGSHSGKSNVFSMIPIWAAIFIPILANQKKNKARSEYKNIFGDENFKRILIAGISIIIIAWVIFNKNFMNPVRNSQYFTGSKK